MSREGWKVGGKGQPAQGGRGGAAVPAAASPPARGGGASADPVLAAIAAGRPAPVYLVHGPDGYRHEEVLGALRHHLVPAGCEALNSAVLEGAAVSPETMVEMAMVPPFGAGRRLLVVRESPLFTRRGKGGSGAGAGAGAGEAAPGARALSAYLRDPAPSACLVFTCVEAVEAGHPLAAEVARCGQVVPAPLPGAADLARWLQAEAAALGRRLAPAAAALIVERCPPDRVLMRNELSKVAAHAGDREVVGREDVLALIGKTREERVFDLVDAVAGRSPARALALMRDLLGQGEPALGILALLARQYRLAWQAKALSGTGGTAAEVARKLQVRPFQAEKAVRQGRRLSDGDLGRAFAVLLEADTAIKTGALSPELALELLCVKLSG